ncbi:MAG TPA: hypothetical protein VGN63_10150 [Flavisolibacter sp.]|jgi:hypothetical protein|nr:hypothetical protein [Flavisolibacter sp.]
MNRYNLFHRIHKGLRALLYDTSILLQRTDFTIQEEARVAISRLQFVISLFEKYQDSEDQYVLPAITAYEPGIAVGFEQEHEETYLVVKKLEALLKDFASTSLPLEQVSIGNEMVALFEEFTLSAILQIGREEQLVNKMLWRYYSDSELQKIALKIIRETETSTVSPYSKWMIRGLNNNEIVHWLKEVRHSADEDEYQTLLKTAAAELHPQRWNLLQDVLFTGMVA